LIRARLSHINGSRIERDGAAAQADDADGPGEGRSRRSAYNLSYRERLSESERLVAGRALAQRYRWDDGEPAEISLEVEFAQRLGVRLGDVLTFDVQGVPVAGRITSLREIRWSSFEPNFFVQFQPGVLEDAPKTHLAALPPLGAAQKEELQFALARDFPNVSAVDVSAVVQRLLSVLAQVERAMSFMAALAVGAGALLLYAIASHQARERRWETNLLKVLGAELGRIRAVVSWEFGLLGVAAASLGGLGSLGLCALLAHHVLRAPWSPSWGWLLATVAGIGALCAATGALATRGVLREKPLVLLQRG
jgi:putative ABC transport system permease protein